MNFVDVFVEITGVQSLVRWKKSSMNNSILSKQIYRLTEEMKEVLKDEEIKDLRQHDRP